MFGSTQAPNAHVEQLYEWWYGLANRHRLQLGLRFELDVDGLAFRQNWYEGIPLHHYGVVFLVVINVFK